MSMTDHFLKHTHLGRSIQAEQQQGRTVPCYQEHPLGEGASRLECEARYWNRKIADRNNLRSGLTLNKRVAAVDLIVHRDEILARIAKKRGQAGADILKQEMERLWPLSYKP